MNRIIDIHAHYYPPAYREFFRSRNISVATAPRREAANIRPPQWRSRIAPIPEEVLDVRFRAMQEARVGRQVLSLAGPYLGDESAATACARLVNDALAELCGRHRESFSFWATLPLPHVDAALAECVRAFDQLGAAGVTLLCFCENESIARPEFDPLFAELDRRNAIVFLHPSMNGLCSHLLNEWGLTVCAGAPLEDAVVAMHLIAAGIPLRFPHIRFIVPHLGGILPVLLERLDGQMPRADGAAAPSATARRFYFDTVGWGSKPALLAAYHAFGDERLLPGSDWPFLLEWETYAQSFAHVGQAGLPAASVERILNRNAQDLLGPDG
jgi:6-methylsalicylate decarboxylase